MHLPTEKTALGILAAVSVLCFCNSPGYGQGPAPAATKNRIKAAVSQPAPQEAVMPPGMKIEIPQSTKLPMQPVSLLSEDEFKNECDDKSCEWYRDPWPFAGIDLDPHSGIISGTPTSPGRYDIRIWAIKKADGKSYEIKKTIEVYPPDVKVVTAVADIPAYPTGEHIRENLQAYGGSNKSLNYRWSLVTGGTLPSGITLYPSGELSGVATTPGTYKFSVEVTDTDPLQGKKANADLVLVINAAPDCTRYTSIYFNGWFPLSKKRDRNPGFPKELPTENDVQCFYSASGVVSIAGKVQYLYGFGEGTNTISADLVSVQMPAPIGTQISFGSSVTGGSSGTTSSSSATAPSGGTGTTSPSSSGTSETPATTVSSATAAAQAGGNFYIHALYPIGQFTNAHFSAYVYGDPKVGFRFNGLEGQTTLTAGTESYFTVPVEVYASYDGIGHTGGFYFDYRGGFESVPGSFARDAGLPQHNFLLQQLAFGFNFVGALRVGAQRFFGPASAFDTQASGFNKWHLVIQLSPKGP